jgi:hypothetical protein
MILRNSRTFFDLGLVSLIRFGKPKDRVVAGSCCITARYHGGEGQVKEIPPKVVVAMIAVFVLPLAQPALHFPKQIVVLRE